MDNKLSDGVKYANFHDNVTEEEKKSWHLSHHQLPTNKN